MLLSDFFQFAVKWWSLLSHAPRSSKEVVKWVAGEIVARWGIFLVSWVAMDMMAIFSLFLFPCRVLAILGGFLSSCSVVVSLCGGSVSVVSGLVVAASALDFPPSKVLVN